MLLHSNATTTYATRRKISAATGSVRSIAAQLGVSVSAVRRWRHRESVEDRSSRPQTIACSIVDDNSERLLELRRKGMSLDDIFEIVMDEMPKLSRSALYRFFKRHGLGKLASPKREPHKCFKEYEPGYLHIDCFYMPRFAGKRSYCFVAVDRATRRTHVAWYSSRSQKVGADFLQQCIDEFEFKIVIVLTDNGTEFTNKSYKAGKAKRIHAFDALCAALESNTA